MSSHKFSIDFISIHAPIVGCDTGEVKELAGLAISIHAPIVGCDGVLVYDDGVHKNFNPRTHRGVRRNR